MKFPGKFATSNLSRDNLSREIGRTPYVHLRAHLAPIARTVSGPDSEHYKFIHLLYLIVVCGAM